MPADVTAALTVRDVLSLEVFASAEVVAGRVGLDRPVRAAHVVDLPHAEFDWGRDHVLLLTSGAGVAGDAEELAALLEKLDARGFAGMVLSTGPTFDTAPAAARAAADRLDFPLVEIPSRVLFIDLTEAVYAELAHRQHALLQRSGAIHEQLTEVVLGGGGLDRVAEALAGLLQRSVTVEDASMRVLATAAAGAVDEARQRSVARGQTSPEVAERLMADGLYARMREAKTYQRVPPMPDLDMTMERIVAPIVVGEEIHGHLWLIAGDEPLTELDELALRHGATVAALLMLTEQVRRDAADARRGDLLEDLLGAGSDPATVSEHAHHLGVRVDRPHQVLLVQADLPAGGGARALGDTLSRWAQASDRRGFTAWRQEGLAWVLEADDDEIGGSVAEQIVSDLAHPGRQLLVAVGQVAHPESGEPVDLRRSYAQARQALSIARALGQHEGVVVFAHLGLWHWLADLSPQALAENRYVTRLRQLADGHRDRGLELLDSLEAYLDHGGRLAEAAADLPVHRNTLLHRLARIEERCAVDLRDPRERLQLHAALKALRLHDRGT